MTVKTICIYVVRQKFYYVVLFFLFLYLFVHGFWVACVLQLLMIPLIMSVLYVWAQLNRDTIVSFWFGTRFKVFNTSL